MKAIFRKSTSFIVALAMIIAVLPTVAVPAAEAADAETIVYHFNAADLGVETSTKISTFSIAGGNNWEVNYDISGSRVKSYGSDFNGKDYGIRMGYDAAATDVNNFKLGFNIVVPNPGTYLVSMGNFDHTDTGRIGIYIASDEITPASKVGEYVSSQSGQIENYQAVGVVKLNSKGIYKMQLVIENGNSTYDYIRTTNIALTPIENIGSYSALDTNNTNLVYDMTVDKNTKLAARKAANLANGITGGDAEEFGLAVAIADGVNWEIDNTSASSVLTDDEKIRVQWIGLAAETAVGKDLVFNLWVPEAGTYSIGSLEGYIDASGIDKGTLLINGEQVGSFGYTEGEAATVASLNYVADTGCETFELAAGENKVTLRSAATNGKNMQYPARITLNAIDTEETVYSSSVQEFNFRQTANFITSNTMIGATANAGLSALPAFVSLDKGWNWEFVPGYSYDILSRDTNVQSGGARFQSYGLACSMGGYFNVPVTSDIVLKLNVSDGGRYAVSVDGGGYTSGGVAAFYLDGVYLGEYDFYDTGNVVEKGYEALRTIDVDEGVHYLTMRSIRAGAGSGRYIMPGVIKLTAVDAAPAVTAISDVAVSATALTVGESATVSGTVSYGDLAIPYAADITDGAGNTGNNAIATVVSSNEDVLKVVGGTVQAVGAGTATVTLKNGNVVSNEVEVTVEKAPVEITNADIFGDVSAYITKEENGFKFTAFSGIDSTDYSEVGFYIGEDKYKVVDGAVYKNVTVEYGDTSTSLTPDDFFTGVDADVTNSYVFFSSKTYDAKPTEKIVFQPYAVSVDGKTETKGHTYTVTLS